MSIKKSVISQKFTVTFIFSYYQSKRIVDKIYTMIMLSITSIH